MDNSISEAFRLAVESEIKRELPRVIAEYPTISNELAVVRARVRARSTVYDKVIAPVKVPFKNDG